MNLHFFFKVAQCARQRCFPSSRKICAGTLRTRSRQGLVQVARNWMLATFHDTQTPLDELNDLLICRVFHFHLLRQHANNMFGIKRRDIGGQARAPTIHTEFGTRVYFAAVRMHGDGYGSGCIDTSADVVANARHMIPVLRYAVNTTVAWWGRFSVADWC